MIEYQHWYLQHYSNASSTDSIPTSGMSLTPMVCMVSSCGASWGWTWSLDWRQEAWTLPWLPVKESIKTSWQLRLTSSGFFSIQAWTRWLLVLRSSASSVQLATDPDLPWRSRSWSAWRWRLPSLLWTEIRWPSRPSSTTGVPPGKLTVGPWKWPIYSGN